MSRENVELIRALYPAPDTDICAMFRDEATFAQLLEALGPLLTDDFESVFVFPAQTRTYPGLEGFRKNWLDWLEPWSTYRTEIEDLIEVDDRILLVLRDRGRREDMDAEVEIIGASICTFRDGKLARWEDYASRSDAFEAMGLRE